jgi:beta-glucosidase
MAEAFVRGAEEQVIASVKHFAANSIEDERFSVNVTLDERTLREVYLLHFKHAIDAGAGSIMTAYNKVNGSYCAENKHLLSDILKGEWGFKGFVESDWVLGTRSTIGSAMAALDIEMPGALFYGDDLSTAVKKGEIPESIIDDHARRTLRARFQFGIFDGLTTPDPSVVESADHVLLARQVEEEAIVLLKNDGALPLVEGTVHTIAVVGPMADLANLGDGGSSQVTPSSAVTPLQGIVHHAGAIAIDHVATSSLSTADLQRIASADAAIVVAGLTAKDEGENSFRGVGDRKTLALSDAQNAMIANVARSNAHTIVVLEGSGVVLVEPWIDLVKGLVLAWYPGMEGGEAIAEVLFGEVNPSGKLPVTFPKTEDQLPPFIHDQTEVTYDYYHGYRLLDRNQTTPRFPFGFGLSYTTFAYANLALDKSAVTPDGEVTVSADVTNTGKVAGDEIAELYVGFIGSAVDRPARTLLGFSRVHLEPGETKTVHMTVPASDLAYWSMDQDRWVIEAIDYSVEVGSSSRDRPLAGRFSIPR